MPWFIWVLALAAAAAALSFLIWRLASRRRSLPCPAFLRWFVELENPFARSNRSSFIVSHLDIKPGMRVADVGCGPGRVTIPLARAVGPGGSVLALDMQQGMLDRVRAKAQAAGLSNIEFVRAGIGEGKLGSGQLDRVVLAAVLGEIPDRAAALKEIYGALKPGGLLGIAELIFDPHFQRCSVVEKLAKEAGFGGQAVYGPGWAYLVALGKSCHD